MADKPNTFCALGLMSGTSMDGIDGALLTTDGMSLLEEGMHSSLTYERPFHHALKVAEYAVRRHRGDMKMAAKTYGEDALSYAQHALELSPAQSQALREEICSYFGGHFPKLQEVIDHSTDLHGQLVEHLLAKAGLHPRQVDVIGYHGQTLYHAPAAGITLQVGCGERLAHQTGIPVVHQFRSNDVANGGQGAPFAPLYHQALAMGEKRIPLALVNCGGISNVTFVGGPHLEEVMGFDTGPGNGLIDLYIKGKTGGRETYDRDGRYGLRGVCDGALKDALYRSLDHFLKQPPPKSLDIGDFALPARIQDLTIEDGARTLEEFTAETILTALDFIPDEFPRQWIAAGGGWKNPVIFNTFERLLKEHIPGATLAHAHEIGWNSEALEAQIFAYLAVRSLKGLPLSTPLTTGVSKNLSGGILAKTSQKNHIYLGSCLS